MAQQSIVDTRSFARRAAARGAARRAARSTRRRWPRCARCSGDAPRRRDLLIEFLHRIQDRYGHLSAAHIVALAQEMKLAMTEVYEVATFYHHFDVVKEGETPPPAITVRVCETLSCQMAGARRAARGRGDGVRPRRARHRRAVHRPLRARAGRGRRPQSGRPRDGRRRLPPPSRTGRSSADDSRVRRLRRLPRSRRLPHAAPRASTASATSDDVIAALEDSALRGLGGAGFPAGRKWRIVRAEPAPRLMAVNIDEGEPGTFKDRYYLERDPHRFLEGMLIAAWAVGIDDIYIYLRDEYAACRAILDAAKSRRSKPIRRARCRSIHLRRGAGAYICGEESAMIESIEGKRGMPRLRPPYVAQVGLFGRPTLEHNMETLYWVRDILEKGADWFAGHGRHGRKGLRSFSVSGRVRQARRAPRAGGHHGARADRRILRRHAARARVLRLPSGRRVGRHPAGVARRHPARLRHAAAARLLHRLGGGHRAVAARPRARRGAQPDAVLRRRILRPVHAVPRRHREGRRRCSRSRSGTRRCWTSSRRRWPTRRSAASGRRRPIRSRA